MVDFMVDTYIYIRKNGNKTGHDGHGFYRKKNRKNNNTMI